MLQCPYDLAMKIITCPSLWTRKDDASFILERDQKQGFRAFLIL